MSAPPSAPAAAIAFWFGERPDDPDVIRERRRVWFRADPAFDREIAERFGAEMEAAGRGELSRWAEKPAGALALILLCDQFPRNVHRGSAEAFRLDPIALRTCQDGLTRALDGALPLIHRAFFYMPLEHSELLADQDEAVGRFESLQREAGAQWGGVFEEFAAYARDHREIVRRFGRFPHRNRVLGRPSTEAEREYLEGGGATFGQ
jgi:uncharacterized protein (DUF924 family)